MNRRTIYILAAAIILTLLLCLLDRRRTSHLPKGEEPAAPSPATGPGEGTAPGGGGPPAAVKDGGPKVSGAPPRGEARAESPGADSPRRASGPPGAGEELTGQVQDLDGAPIGGAILRLARDEGLSEGPEDRLARSDATGRFRFLGLAEGSWRLSASHPGRLSITGHRVDAPPEGSVVVVMALDRPAAVQVVDERGAPLAGAEISTRIRDIHGAPAAGASAATGPDGRALLEGLPEEDHVAVEVRAGMRDRPAASLTRSAGELRGSMHVIELAAGGSIGGQVVDSGGAPKANVKLVLVPASRPAGSASSSRWTLHTVSTGQFLFTRIPCGEYDLHADGGEAGRRKVPGLKVEPAASPADLLIQLAAPGSAEANDAIPPPPAVAIRAHQAGPLSGTGSIRGRLSSGGPAPSFAVGLAPHGSRDGPTRIYRQSARRPEFNCPGVPAGTYDVVLLIGGEVRSRASGVKVEPGATAAVEMVME
jgi:carboxypeptidase family protein